MTELEIVCRRAPDGTGWVCDVSVDVDGGTRTEHQVTVAGADLARLDPHARDPHVLVDRTSSSSASRIPRSCARST